MISDSARSIGRREHAMRIYDIVSLRRDFEGRFISLSTDLSRRFGSEHMIIVFSAFSFEIMAPFSRIIYSGPIVSKESAVQHLQASKAMDDTDVPVVSTIASSKMSDETKSANHMIYDSIHQSHSTGPLILS